MVDLIYCLTNLLVFDIPLLYCYTNLNSSIMCCLFSGDMYFLFGASISLLTSFFEYNSDGDFFKMPVIWLAILLSIKSPADVF